MEIPSSICTVTIGKGSLHFGCCRDPAALEKAVAFDRAFDQGIGGLDIALDGGIFAHREAAFAVDVSDDGSVENKVGSEP